MAKKKLDKKELDTLKQKVLETEKRIKEIDIANGYRVRVGEKVLDYKLFPPTLFTMLVMQKLYPDLSLDNPNLDDIITLMAIIIVTTNSDKKITTAEIKEKVEQVKFDITSNIPLSQMNNAIHEYVLVLGEIMKVESDEGGGGNDKF